MKEMLDPAIDIVVLAILAFAILLPGSGSHSIIANSLKGSPAVSGDGKSGDIMEHFRTRQVLCASPTAQRYREIIGSAFGDRRVPALHGRV